MGLTLTTPADARGTRGPGLDPTTTGVPPGARDRRRVEPLRVVDPTGTTSVLVTPSLLLTSRDVASTVREAHGRSAVLDLPWRAAGFWVVLEPDEDFVTSPALGWTLVRVEDRGLPMVPLRRLSGLVLPPVSCGGRAVGRPRWVEGRTIRADLDLRLRVLGGRGERLRVELGL